MNSRKNPPTTPPTTPPEINLETNLLDLFEDEDIDRDELLFFEYRVVRRLTKAPRSMAMAYRTVIRLSTGRNVAGTVCSSLGIDTPRVYARGLSRSHYTPGSPPEIHLQDVSFGSLVRLQSLCHELAHHMVTSVCGSPYEGFSGSRRIIHGRLFVEMLDTITLLALASLT